MRCGAHRQEKMSQVVQNSCLLCYFLFLWNSRYHQRCSLSSVPTVYDFEGTRALLSRLAFHHYNLAVAGV